MGEMREILFRGKRVDNGEWETGSLIVERMNTSDQQVMIADKMTGYPTLVFPETVGQYTGIKDKNGKGIFDGDIILLREHDGTKTVQKATPIYFGEYIDSDSAFEDYSCIGFYLKIRSECCNIGILLSDKYEGEVIGNIYDNPELLEGKT